jgi:23S rRNA pseudouridine2457 synthase
MSKYLAFYKPFGVLCQFTDLDGRATLKDYISIPGVYSVGRLDFDSEGLLLLTDDGITNHRLTDPRFEHPKRYMVQVEGPVSEESLNQLGKGVYIQGYQTRPAVVKIVNDPELPPRAKVITPHGPTSWLSFEIFEGKKRQIRHMTAAVGLPTLRLVRIGIGPIGLGNLLPGEWRYLLPEELGQIRQLVKMGSKPLHTVKRVKQK